MLDPSTISLDHAWWFPERAAEDTGNGCYDTYVSNANVIIEAGCRRERGSATTASRTCARVYTCAPEEIIGDTDMDEIVSRFAPNEELV